MAKLQTEPAFASAPRRCGHAQLEIRRVRPDGPMAMTTKAVARIAMGNRKRSSLWERRLCTTKKGSVDHVTGWRPWRIHAIGASKRRTTTMGKKTFAGRSHK